MFPVVFYGCENWTLALNKEHILKVLRITFEQKREEIYEEG
jgi:hypothetical protein